MQVQVQALQVLQVQEQDVMEAAGRAGHRGAHSTLHLVASAASLTQQHATDQQHDITHKQRRVSKKNATE